MIKEGTVILGIDPGTNILGFGIVRVGPDLRPQYVDMGVLDLRKVESPYEKLRIIHDKTGALCDLHHPAFLAIESPFYGRNAQVIFKLGRAQGAAVVAALERGAEVHEYAPRKATDALALALCHFYQMSSPLSGREGSSSWEKFVAANPERILKK